MSSIVQLPLFDGKVCTACGQWKPHTEYYLHEYGRAASGYRKAQCKSCVCAKKYARRHNQEVIPTSCVQQPQTTHSICRTCGQQKPLEEFYIRSETGRPRRDCKACISKKKKYSYNRDYNERRAAANERYHQRKDDPEYRQARRSQSLRHRDKQLQTKATYRAARREELREKARTRYHRDPGPFKVRASFRKRLVKYRTEGNFSWSDWTAMCAWFGGICLRCGKKKRLTIDHVQPLVHGGMHTIDNLQPLCRSCNCSKKDKYIDYRDPDSLAAFLATL